MSVLSCPVCKGAMREVNREGILIDVCTQCRGVWLDRGELEKLAAFMPTPMSAPRPMRPAPDDRGYRDDDRGQRDDDRGYRDDDLYRASRRGRDVGYDDDDDDRRYRRDDDDSRRYRRDDDDRGDPRRSGIGRFLDLFD
jgi:Zn-finger nucleic acid-binding protein